jgi:hypothetical protein
MSWFSTVSNAPLVEVQQRKYNNGLWVVATGDQYTQSVVIQEWERRGLTDTAADTYLTALADSGYSATKTPIGGGGYNVRYSSATIGTWDT